MLLRLMSQSMQVIGNFSSLTGAITILIRQISAHSNTSL